MNCYQRIPLSLHLMFQHFLHLSKQVILTYLLNHLFQIPCVALNANALDMDRIPVEASWHALVAVSLTMTTRPVSTTLLASTARVITVHTRESVHSGNWKNRLSFPEARKLAAPKVVGKTYAAVAAAPKPITKRVAVNTELTWHSDDAKYRKLSDIAKTDKQVQKAAKKNKRTKHFRTKNRKRCLWT